MGEDRTACFLKQNLINLWLIHHRIFFKDLRYVFNKLYRRKTSIVTTHHYTSELLYMAES